MATTNASYDAPVYTTPVIFSGLSAVGASGVTTKWSAYTAMKVMSVTQGPVIATTAAGSQPLLFTKTGTTTSTTTFTSALTSASSAAVNFALATPVSLAQGDQFWYTHGTDATAAVSVAVECRVIPGSNYTAP